MKNKNLRNDKIKYLQLSELGTKHNLSFSSHEVVGNKIIGLDGIKRKLLVFEKSTETDQINVIQLNEISSISLRKIYDSIKPGALKKRKLYEFLKSIFLQIDFKDARETFVLHFYEKGINRVFDLPGLEKKVKNWQVFLSKMIGCQNNKLDGEKGQLSLAG